jgi:hypothetical protein
MESFDNTVKKSLSFIDFDNDYVKSGIALFLVLYSGIAAPRLPEYVARLFDYTLVKLFIFFMIIYVARQDPTIAIIASVAVLVSLMTLSNYKFNKEMMNSISAQSNDYELALRNGSTVPQYTLAASDGLLEGFTEGLDSDQEYPDLVENMSNTEISGVDEGNHLTSIDEAHKVESHEGSLNKIGSNSKTTDDQEEQKVRIVLAKADEYKRKLQRDLTNDELKQICNEVNKKYASRHYQTDLDTLGDCSLDANKEFRNSGEPSSFDTFPREVYGSVN